MKKVFVTKKGSEMKSNNWKEGQEINVHENIAEHYIKNGIASDEPIEDSKKDSKNKK